MRSLIEVADGLTFSAAVSFLVAMVAFAARRPAVVGAGRTAAVPDVGRGEPRGRLASAAVPLTGVATGLLLASMICRGVGADRLPWANMYEFACMSALALACVFLVVLRAQPQLTSLGSYALVPVVVVLGVAMTTLYTDAGPVVAALRSYWMAIHVLAIIVAVGAFSIGAVTSLAVLRVRRLERQRPDDPRPPCVSSAALDQLAHRIHSFAYPMWTFAVVAGAIWAESAWGRYWGWDAKEVWAFVTWIVYSAYLHARSTAGWGPKRSALIAVLGYATVLFNFTCVNLLLTGLHSYGGL